MSDKKHYDYSCYTNLEFKKIKKAKLFITDKTLTYEQRSELEDKIAKLLNW